ncbi:hypothetical protein ACQKE4_18740 [Halomonas sp. NPDC076908]|uniref:hypothetical protein n=1 Tax=Halomonas sp. NPDC076908 TaxID=3390567 RepID=UPI003CFD10A6
MQDTQALQYRARQLADGMALALQGWIARQSLSVPSPWNKRSRLWWPSMLKLIA